MTFLLGVEWKDCRQVAELIGIKSILNEFIGYNQLSQLINNRINGVSPSISVSTLNAL